MQALRQEAHNLLEMIPEEHLMSVINILRGVQEITTLKNKMKKNIDLNNYMNHGERMFSNTEEIDEYIRGSRNDRF